MTFAIGLSTLATAQDAPAPPQPAPSADTTPLPPVVVETKQDAPKTKAKTKKKAAQKGPVSPTPAAAPAPQKPVNDPSSIQSATGPVNGFVATNSATATKTNTPLIETPQSVSVVTADQIQEQGVETLGQALRYVPGVTAETFGIENRDIFFTYRGFKASSESLYRDGLPLGGSLYAGLTGFDVYGVDRLEVFRGPTSVLYGQNNPGGLINFVSKKPTETPFNEVELSAGSFSNYGAKFDFSGPANADKSVLYRVTGVVRDSETQTDFVDADRYYIAPSLTFRPADGTTLTLLANYQYDGTGFAGQFLPRQGTELPNINSRLPVSAFLGEPNHDNWDTQQYSAGYLFEHKANETWTFRQNARYAHFDNHQSLVYGFDSLDPVGQREMGRSSDRGESRLESYVIDNQAQAKFSTGAMKHTLLIGTDYRYSDAYDFGAGGPADPIDIFNPVYTGFYDASAPYQDGSLRQHQVGVYAQEQIKFGGFVLTLGGRQDWVQSATDGYDFFSGPDPVPFLVKGSDDAFTGRAGLVYLFDNGLAPYVSYSESFLPASDPSHPEFVPETGQQYEAGVKYQPKGYNSYMTIAAFDLTRQNVTTTDPTPVDPFNQAQRGEVRSRGIEIETVASLDDEWDVRGAYAYTDIEVTKDPDAALVGRAIYGVPMHQFSLWADHNFKYGTFSGLGLGAGLRYLGASWGDTLNTFKVQDVALVDAAIHYDWDIYRLSLNVSNIFDTEYVASCDDVWCYYGQERTLLATLRTRW